MGTDAEGEGDGETEWSELDMEGEPEPDSARSRKSEARTGSNNIHQQGQSANSSGGFTQHSQLIQSFSRALAAKKQKHQSLKAHASESEYPSDLDDLSDADFSDADRSMDTLPAAPTTTSSSVSASTTLLGRAAVDLHEFDVTPELEQLWSQSEQHTASSFEGTFATLRSDPAVYHRVHTLLSGVDSLSTALRNEYVASRFDARFILSCSQMFNMATTPTAASSSRSIGAKSLRKSGTLPAPLPRVKSAHARAATMKLALGGSSSSPGTAAGPTTATSNSNNSKGGTAMAAAAKLAAKGKYATLHPTSAASTAHTLQPHSSPSTPPAAP
jgi:hypothetical protein